MGYLVVVNLNPWRAYGRIPLPAAVFENGKQYVFFDRLDGKRYERAGGELITPGLYIALEAHQLQVLLAAGNPEAVQAAPLWRPICPTG